MRLFIFVLLLSLFSCLAFPVVTQAQDARTPSFRSTDLPLPRFVSLNSDKVYLRAGPGLRYPVKWVYERKTLPVEITQEFESWRKIKDHEGEEGWIHTSLLSGERYILILSEEIVPAYADPSTDSRMVMRTEPYVVAHLDKCGETFCRIEKDGYRGWIEKKFLWGIYPDGELD